MKRLRTMFYFLILLICYSQNGFAGNMTTRHIVFNNIESVRNIHATLPDYDILIVSFKFDPYNTKLLETYLPDGYITINGEYDMTDLISKLYFYPIIDQNDIKYLILDLDPFFTKPSVKKSVDLKMLVENLSEYIYRSKKTVRLGFKFSYNKRTQQSLETLFSYTSIPISISGLDIVSGYQDFIRNKELKVNLNNINYLNLSNNLIGSSFESYLWFLKTLTQFKNLEVLDLNNNSIGGMDGNLLLFANKIEQLKKLQYLSMGNNLIGVYPKDTVEFKDKLKKIKRLTLNLNDNPGV